MTARREVREAKREILGALAQQMEGSGYDEATALAAKELAAEFRRRSSSSMVLLDERQLTLV